MILFLKSILRRILYLILGVSHSQGIKKNIILFSTRRGGSTLFSQLISLSEPNLRYYDHLFSWFQTDFYSRRFFNVKKNNQEIYLTKNNSCYFELVDSGDHIARTVCNPFAKDFVRKSNRILYKVTEGKGLFDWFIMHDNIDVVYQLRHPIATALSIMRLGWNLTIDAYLMNQKFIDEYLTGDKYDYCIAIKNGDDLLKKYVLNWVLENLIPLSSKNLKSVFIISYEEMLMNPKKYIQELCDRLDLDGKSIMYNSLKDPSRSSTFSKEETIQEMKSLDAKSLISNWKKYINNNREKELMMILEKFEIDIYTLGKLTINKKYVI
tara:strand:- start:5291 stop:6259 length:969 start_codon:yes stop_codon:yes gene_type:complete